MSWGGRRLILLRSPAPLGDRRSILPTLASRVRFLGTGLSSPPTAVVLRLWILWGKLNSLRGVVMHRRRALTAAVHLALVMPHIDTR